MSYDELHRVVKVHRDLDAPFKQKPKGVILVTDA
jgi:hypothetical protein